MRRRPSHIRVRAGQFEFVKLNAKKFDLRDTYHLILNLNWPGFAGFVFGVYLLINLVFAALYMLNPHAVAEMSPGSFFDAFFFSVETLATVGYGHMYPASFYGHLIAMLEIMVGMFGLAVITGLIFVRFSRPTARMYFSKVAVISPSDGVPNLMIRLANLRHQRTPQVQELTSPFIGRLDSLIASKHLLTHPFYFYQEWRCTRVVTTWRLADIFSRT